VIVLDNANPLWLEATAARDILLACDLEMMRYADVVLWHHDAATEGQTARIELGILAGAKSFSIVHANAEVPSLAYMEALCGLHPNLHWCSGTLEEAVSLAVKLAKDVAAKKRMTINV
jgi:hypothetical protein